MAGSLTLAGQRHPGIDLGSLCVGEGKEGGRGKGGRRKEGEVEEGKGEGGKEEGRSTQKRNKAFWVLVKDPWEGGCLG